MAKSKKKKKRKVVARDVSPVAPEESSVGESIAAESGWRVVMNEPVAVFLAMVVALRPWRDGMTYPQFNVYYVVGIAAAALGYCGYRMIRGNGLRFPVPVGIFAILLLVMYGSALGGINYDVSLRQFLQQSSYFFLFLLASQGLRTRLGIGMVLSTLLVTSLVNTVWSVVHAEFVLPFVRESIANRPALLMFYFGSDVLTPELKHRLEMSRAFGTFLHPNALAGYLVLCIPLMAAWGAASFSRMKVVVDSEKPTGGQLNTNFATLMTGGLAGFFMYFYLYSLNTLLLSHTEGMIPLINGTARTVFYLFILPVAFATVSGYLVHMKGVLGFGRILGTIMMLMTVGMQFYALWLTYSRGAMLGLFVGVALAGVMLLCALPRVPVAGTVGRRFAELMAVGLLVTGTLFPAAHAFELQDNGFVLPDTRIDYRPKGLSYEVSELAVEGRDVSVSEFVSPQSLSFRLTYWQVGMQMVKDHFLLGVGLGNFGTAYGAYQFLDAHDVKTAHNDYLQMFAETGVFGFIAFVGFWVYFLVWGGARIAGAVDWRDRLLLAGIYAGVVALLAHAFVDFDFQNASLAMMLYLLVGVFFACVGVTSGVEDQERVGSLHRLVTGRVPMCVGMIFAVVVLLGGVRQARYDYGWTIGEGAQRFMDIGNRFERDIRADMMDFLVGGEVQGWDGKNVVPRREVFRMRALVNDDAAIRKLGMVRVSMNDGTDATREVPDTEEIPDNGYIFVTNKDEARALALRVGPVWLERLEKLEELYPHGTDVPRQGYRFARGMARASQDRAVQLVYSEQCLVWARKRAERSPMDPEAQIELCGGLWERGKADPTVKQLEYYRDGVAVYESALSLHPTSQQMYEQYAESMEVIGKAFINAGKQAASVNPTMSKTLREEGEGYMRSSEAGYRRRDLLVRYKHDVLQLR